MLCTYGLSVCTSTLATVSFGGLRAVMHRSHFAVSGVWCDLRLYYY